MHILPVMAAAPTVLTARRITALSLRPSREYAFAADPLAPSSWVISLGGDMAGHGPVRMVFHRHLLRLLAGKLSN